MSISAGYRMAQSVNNPYANYPNVSYQSPPPATPGVYELDTPNEKKELSPPSTKSEITLAYHPLSIAIVAFWTVLVIGLLVLLERSAALAPTTVHQPWYYSNDGLPSVLLTVFAQGHGPVTAMHLGRLSISALQFRRSSPRTWLELFWMADRKWAGPVGVLLTAVGVVQRRLRVSYPLVLFSLLSLLALVTPLVLNRAYPIRTLDVRVPQMFAPNTFTPSKLNGLDAYAQAAAGGGAWATNQTVYELFNSSTFTAVGAPRPGEPGMGDVFFAGDVQGLDTTLPGMRITGGCKAVPGQTGLDNLDAFSQFCSAHLPSVQDIGQQVVNAISLSLNVSYCSTYSFQAMTLPSNSSAYMWFQNTNGTGMIVGDLVAGLVQCNTYTTTGTADVFGRSLSFANFAPDPSLYVDEQGGEDPLDPLYAAIYHLNIGRSGSEDDQAGAIDMLGYVEVTHDEGLYYVSPTLDGFAQAMWHGAQHMTNAFAVLTRSTDTVYAATAHVPVSGRVKANTFVAGAIALLVLWFVGVVGMTAALWRATAFGDSLDSYAAGRLLVDKPDLVSGECGGGVGDNARLLEKLEA